jgi:molybdopterin-guanine dinucleotide biosynthesis protein A
MREGITGIVLAGGMSRRMGQPKALMPWGGGRLIDAVIARLSRVVDEVLIVAKDTAPFVGGGARVVADLKAETHPWVGLSTGLLKAAHEICFVCACDMPWLQPPVIRYLVGALDGFDAAIPQGPSGLEPFHAVYRRRCLAIMEQAWDAGGRTLQGLLGALQLRLVPPQELRAIEGWQRSFMNLNTPEDAAYADGVRPAASSV